jgi:hypothetical protein
MAWLTDVRKVALLACVTSVASMIPPLWNTAQSMIATASQAPQQSWRMMPLALATFLASALLPVFYFALFSDEGSVQVSERLRLLARAAAFTLGILLVFKLAPWIKSPTQPVPTWLGALATIANILLLAALSHSPGDESEEPHPTTARLYVATKVTVITWGVWVAFSLLRVLLLPYTYSQTRGYLLSIGREGPVLADMANEAVQTFVSSACLWAAPYIIYRSRLSPTASAYTDPSDTTPLDEHSPDSSPGT